MAQNEMGKRRKRRRWDKLYEERRIDALPKPSQKK
jgi:hypothetical protein